jgi:chromosome segregation ATPase
MAKFLHILAASVGGGLVLGAGIRLGEAICGSGENKSGRGGREVEAGGELTRRLDRIEREVLVGRQESSEADPALAGVVERMDRQQREMEAMRRQISNATRAFDSAGTGPSDLRRELTGELDKRLAVVEESLRRSLDASNREAVESMVSTLEKRLAPRISRIESELSGQSASVAELREYALQSERSILRLLTALEKTMGTKQEEADSPRLSVVR